MIKDLVTFFIKDLWAIPILYAGMVASWVYLRYALLDKGAAKTISVFACLVPALFLLHPLSRFLLGMCAIGCTLIATAAIIYDRNESIWKWFMEPILPKIKKLFASKPKDPETDDAFNRGYY